MHLSPLPDENGIFRQWVNCASIKKDDPRFQQAQDMLAAYDELWQSPDLYYPVGKSEGVLELGLLKAHGYEVRTGGANDRATRRHLLGRIFERQLGPLVSKAYHTGWGAPKTEVRLKRMISALGFQLSQRDAHYTRNAIPKRRWSEDKIWLEACLDTLRQT